MNNHPKKTIIKRRCDEAMRRSKEKADGQGDPFKCAGECKNCICCIEMDNYLVESHVNLLAARKGDAP